MNKPLMWMQSAGVLAPKTHDPATVPGAFARWHASHQHLRKLYQEVGIIGLDDPVPTIVDPHAPDAPPEVVVTFQREVVDHYWTRLAETLADHAFCAMRIGVEPLFTLCAHWDIAQWQPLLGDDVVEISTRFVIPEIMEHPNRGLRHTLTLVGFHDDELYTRPVTAEDVVSIEEGAVEAL